MNFKDCLKLVVKEHVENKSQIVEMAMKDLKKQYSGTIFGMLWPVLKNLIFVFAYWFTITIGLKSERSVGAPYMVWLAAGLVPWFFIRDTLVPAARSIRSQRFLVTKVIFPKSIISTYKVFAGFISSFMFLGIVMVICFCYGVFPTIYWIQVIYYALAALALMIAISLTTSTLVVLSRDIEFLLNSTIVLVFWLTPILWDVENLSGILAFIVKLNPFYYVIGGFRESIVGQTWFWEHPTLTLYYWGVVVVLFLIGAFIHGKARDHFADVL